MRATTLLNLNDIRPRNALAILNALRLRPALSRSELARELNCDATTVTRVTRDLIALGALRMEGVVKSTGGRPREPVSLNAGWKIAIGVELSPRHITGVLVDLKGNVLVRERALLSADRTRDEFVESLHAIVSRLLDSISREKLLGVGVASFGLFAGREKVLENVAAYPAIVGFDIPGFFEHEFGISPEITDVTSASMLHEVWFDHVAAEGSLMLFSVDAGIGCAVAIDGKPVLRKHACAGEFGHTIFDPGGDRCGCGRRGCLETLCSTAVLERTAREIASDPALDFTTISKEYVAGEARFHRAVQECATWLGIAVANQVNSLAPDHVSMTGEMFELGAGFSEHVLSTVEDHVFPAFREGLTLRLTDTWKEGVALGAASQQIRKVFESLEQF